MWIEGSVKGLKVKKKMLMRWTDKETDRWRFNETIFFSFMVSKGYDCQAVVLLGENCVTMILTDGWENGGITRRAAMSRYYNHPVVSSLTPVRVASRLAALFCSAANTWLIKDLCFHLLCLSNC